MLIYLIGYMGSGKTTVGKKLAAKLGYNFVDLDKKIETDHKITIPSIFQKYDEETFRLLERKCLNKTFHFSNTVISTGGGTPCFYDNMELINKNGISVYLQLNPKSLYTRLINSKQTRPLLNNKSEDEILLYIEKSLITRDVYYLKASIIAKGENIKVNDLSLLIRNSINN